MQFLFDLHYIVVWFLLLNVIAGDPLGLGIGTLESTWRVGVFTPGVVWGLIVSVGPIVFATVILKVFGKSRKSLRWSVLSDVGNTHSFTPTLSHSFLHAVLVPYLRLRCQQSKMSIEIMTE